MFIPTHMLIAVNILNVIQENLKIKLDYKSFLYGNIRPDIDSVLLSIPHYKNESFAFVMDIIDSIQFETLPTYNKTLKVFSANLGIVNHYLSDFFCYAHNNTNLDKFIPHFLYENNLALQFCRTDIRKICNSAAQYAASIPIMDIKNYVNNKYADYINTIPSMDKDILYSLEVCSSVSYVIVKKCLNSVLFNIA